jgi:4-hydroxy-tetrahydrodipicolinate reductase
LLRITEASELPPPPTRRAALSCPQPLAAGLRVGYQGVVPRRGMRRSGALAGEEDLSSQQVQDGLVVDHDAADAWTCRAKNAIQRGPEMAIRVCLAGVSGWTGSAVARAILASDEFELTGAIARRQAGRDAGELLGLPANRVVVTASLGEALARPADVLVDFTTPDSVKQRTLEALAGGVRVVIGTSGLTAVDYADIERTATENRLGVIAAGNFSLTAALAKHFALLAAKHLPSWEIIDYAHAEKSDAPSGTTRELAEALGEAAQNKLAVPVERTHGDREARGATIAGTQVHSIRLPGIVLAFEAIFGLPNERLTIRHDAGQGAEPYVNGTLLAVRRVMEVAGLVRGLDRLLFST